MVALATIDGITRGQAAENYLKALVALVTYLCAGIDLELWQRPAHDAFRYANRLGPTPEAVEVVTRFQVREHLRFNPPFVRTLELVS